ncbi:unnamed protein product [Schistocephalus solidus]|uniref:BEN domain-containing protein n=1 Tax=Schistocephalus solidus TaxID=70667 RepID=A0A183TU75_SCHSO|nr:unnamed protein product [Schistocephalus solidus]
MEFKNIPFGNRAKYVVPPRIEPRHQFSGSDGDTTELSPHDEVADLNFNEDINTNHNTNDLNSRHVSLKSPPAKRVKSLISFLDVNYEDEACAICFKLLQKISEIEKDMKELIMEIEKLKKPPHILPEPKQSLTGEHERDKRTYVCTASVAITSNKDDGATSTKLGLAVKRSPERKEGNRQGSQKMKKHVSEDKGNMSSKNISPRSPASDKNHSHVEVSASTNNATSVNSQRSVNGQIRTSPIKRKRNIVIRGVPESTSCIPKERVTHDLDLLYEYTSAVLKKGEIYTV